MTIASVWHTASDTSFTNGAVNYGPLTIAAGQKLTRVRVRGTVVLKGSALAPTAYLANWLQNGLQYGVHGYTPASLEGSNFQPSVWLKAEGFDPKTTAVAWAPSTDTGAYLAAQNVSLTWHGQLKLGSTIDIYYSIGRYNNVGIGAGAWVAIEAIYS